ncbi:glutamate racemase [Plesiomonas shigelloides]|uniref:glutamate racemase n=1 Tax=Plesiomonas shigelloides TaxID=703 RepID=UPI000EE7C433|nr:glutamate racemase [Plesiomonas shigelloides]KAB7680240.1 glutamate racemase [Plesiomonas shigelloides]MCX2533884.1 glutamate racemase [Plesiomonas shigelloides]QIY08753.1 glutamate racemase [Plesiomonas shigelloides]QOH79538.1 glutamate racemase [Plesiomonas shigelloides]HAD40080.1 glutamate racemase [Plesiomonas shigelloides]
MTSDEHPLIPRVLIFDSGVGGLSVYQEIRQLLPDLPYIYAFDNACFPYGEQPQELIVERVLRTVAAVHQRHPLCMAVIACNTASTISLPALRKTFSFPIVGVVPAIKPAAAATRNGVVGLLATRATVKRPYTHTLIKQFASTCDVRLLGSAELVQLAEEKMQGKEIDKERLRAVLQPWLDAKPCPDVWVLACTHFPLLKAELQQLAPAGVQLIDSGQAVARRVKSLFSDELLATAQGLSEPNRAYCTHWDEKTATLASLFARENLGQLQLLPV